MNTINNDLQQIIDYSHKFAKHMLIRSGEYFPFGAQINMQGDLASIGYEDEESDIPNSEEVISELSKALKDQLDVENIRAYGITSHVIIAINQEGDKSDAIMVDIQHKDDAIPLYCFPYHWTANRDLIFGESFVMNREYMSA